MAGVDAVRVFLLAAALSVGFSPPTAFSQSPAPRKENHEDATRLIGVWLHAQREFDRLPGISAGVVVGEDLVWSGAYGTLDAAGSVPARTDTIYSVCSISKVFTAIAIMRLVEEKRLRLDDDIGDVLPEYRIAQSDPDSGPLTIRSLLTHSSGLPGEAGFAGWEAPGFAFPSRDELRGKIPELRTAMAAGNHHKYSNLGYTLLGLAVEKVAGMSYEDYVQRNILGPLKMEDTRPRLPTELYGTRLAQGYGALRRDGTREAFKPFEIKSYVGAAGLTSTVPDLARFVAWQFRLLKNGGREVISAASLREMQRVQWTNPDGKATWGLGFGVSFNGTNRSVGHTGLCPGYLSAFALSPRDRTGVIVMTNSQVEIAEYSRGMRALLEKGRSLPARTADGKRPDFTPFTGLYSYRGRGGEVAVVPWGENLATLPLPTKDPAGSLAVIKHVEGDRFRYVADDGRLADEVVFRRGPDGRVTGYALESNTSPRIGDLPAR